MDGGAAAAIEVLVQTLVDVSKEEISLIRGLNKDVEQLQTTLGMIKSYLNDAEKKVITQEAVRTWLRELETLAFGADNVLDEFNYHLLHKQSYMHLGNICGIKLTSLTKLEIEGLDALERLPDWLFNNNQNLSELKIIYSCHKLRELSDGLHTLNYLESLTIRDCPSLKSIGYPSGGGQSRGRLHRLLIEGCEELIELPREMIELWAPGLETLTLKRLKSLNNLPVVIECLAKSARLRELKIIGVPKFMATSGVGSWHFPRLQEIEIEVSRDMECILEGCSHSLTELMITGVENLESVPESIQYLTGLVVLKLENFGMEELPQWFGNLSSLWVLHVRRCKRLKRQLTKLNFVVIKGCPELCIDYEWRNFPNLCINKDGHYIGRRLSSGSL